MSIADLRREYARGELDERTVDPDPFRQLRVWLDQALAAELIEPTAMTLATATPDGRPSARIVLLKALDERGLVFFSSYEGRKGKELAENPRAALLFYWAELERQVRVEGPTERVAEAESDDYFRRRPVESRLSAAASPQSAVVPSRAFLEERVQELRRQYPDGNVPRPTSWGGTRVVPVLFEFWQGRPNRLHDRVRYRRDESGNWVIERLGP
ncbi:MAG TPA: pyridoxamine 5'-phosphate oxidase [Gemmataceae bacterium]